MSQDEKVMCVPRNKVESVLGVHLKNDTVYYEDMGLNALQLLCAKEHVHWVARKDCESDPSFKQIIPYIMIRVYDDRDSDFRYLVYNRTKQSGEGRLKGKASIGIGGHITEPETIRQGLFREIEEELETYGAIFDLSFMGFVNNESDEVGKVHLGALFIADFPYTNPPILKCDALAEPRWLTERELMDANKEEFEVWSQLAITFLTEEN